MVPYKLPNSAAHKIAVTGTAATLLSLINTAASATVAFPYDLDYVIITPESGDIRYTTTGTVPTAANGILIQDNEETSIKAALVDINLISVTGTVNCNVQIGWHRGIG